MAGDDQNGVQGVPSDTQEREIWTCKGCQKSSDSKPELKWIVCALCEGKFDTKCQGIKAIHYTAWKEKNDMLWLCPGCMIVYCPDPARSVIRFPPRLPPKTPPRTPENKPKEISLQTVYEKLVEVCDNQISMEATLNVIHTDVIDTTPKSLMEDFEDKLESVKTSINSYVDQLPTKIEERPTFAELRASKPKESTQASNPVSVENLKKALLEVTEEEKEQELRSRGIVIYRAPEKVRDSSEPKQQEDDEGLVRELVRYLECDVTEIISVTRLGKFIPDNITNGRFRPLKVRFNTNAMRDKVLDNLPRLKHAEDRLKTLSIRQDLNYQQRLELNNKVQEAKEMSKGKEDRVVRVRGTPGNYRFVEILKNFRRT